MGGKMLDRFRELVANRHQYAEGWKARTAGKVMGFFCCYAPEELIYAAGMLPVRVLGGHEPQDLSAPHIHSMFCPFSRNTLAEGLKGHFDYLDGVAMGQSCMHMMQGYDSWRWNLPVSYSYFMSFPAKVQSPLAKTFLMAELADFKASLEGYIGRAIADSDLRRAIDIHNTNRSLLR